jgi:hypothetical protein
MREGEPIVHTLRLAMVNLLSLTETSVGDTSLKQATPRRCYVRHEPWSAAGRNALPPTGSEPGRQLARTGKYLAAALLQAMNSPAAESWFD